MSDRLEKIKAKKAVVYSIAAFWLTILAVIIVHNITGAAGVRLDFSISKYVGLSFPSAILFLITNCFVAISMWRYIKPKLKTKTQVFLMKYIMIMLVLLSLFPIGLFDNIIPNPIIFGRTPISFLHVLTSRTMFFAMAAFAAVTFYEGKSKRLHEIMVQKASLMFFIFAAVCIFTFIFFSGFFWKLNIVLESIYIGLFFVLAASF